MMDWQVAQRLMTGIAYNIRYGAYYYLTLLGGFMLLWCWLRRRPSSHPIQSAPLPARQMRREIATSLLFLLVSGCVMPILYALGLGRHTQFYWRVATHGWPYFFVSIVLMMIVQDTYFYWTHRLMHHRRLFRWFHRTHHRSTNVSPLSTYSVHPLEALVGTGSGIVILLLVPVSQAALITFSIINTAYAIYTHLGYELLPRATAQHWLGRWINTSVAHNIHHARARYNYGWYFLFWDRAMGTLSPGYAERYAIAATPKTR